MLASKCTVAVRKAYKCSILRLATAVSPSKYDIGCHFTHIYKIYIHIHSYTLIYRIISYSISIAQKSFLNWSRCDCVIHVRNTHTGRQGDRLMRAFHCRHYCSILFISLLSLSFKAAPRYFRI